MRDVVSNSRRVLSSVPKDALSRELKELDLSKDNLPGDQVLGICWVVQDDTLKIKTSLKSAKPSRRNILSSICSFLDPLGLAAPAVVLAKSIFQETCRL